VKIAFVASAYNETDKIKKQLKEKKIKNIDVFDYGSEPNGYDKIITNVRANKKNGEILDLSQCLQTHGFPEEQYFPPERTGDKVKDKTAKEEIVSQMRMPHLKAILNQEKPKSVTKELYLSKINELMSNSKKLTELDDKDLITKFEISQNPTELIAICAVIMDRVVCTDQIDDYGRRVKGYIATNGKLVHSFLNADSITWMAELWDEKLPKETIYYRNKYIKALKTKIKSVIKEQQSIWALRFFIDFLLEQDKFEKETFGSGSGSGEPNPAIENTTVYKTDKYDIVIDEDEIPF